MTDLQQRLKARRRYTPEDGFFLMEDGPRYYTAELQKNFRGPKIGCAPILIVQEMSARAR